MTAAPHKDREPPAIETGEPPPWAPSRWEDALERLAARPMLNRAYATARIRYTLGNFVAALPFLLLRLVPALLLHVRMILVGLGRVLVAWAGWRRRDDWLKDVQAAEGPKRIRARELFEKRKKARSLWSTGALAGTLITALVAAKLGYDEYVLAVLLLALAGLDAIGHRARRPVAGDTATGPAPASPLREGTSVRLIVGQVADVLTGQGHTPTITDHAITDHGIEVRVHSAREVTDDDLRALERGLQSFPGAVSQARSVDNAAVTTVRVLWEDPLARSLPPPPRQPLSRSITDPAELGMGVAAKLLELRLMRTNVGIVGGPGAGKTMALTAMLDALTACGDVVLHGIDLKGGIGLIPWGDCVRQVATTPKEAKEILAYGVDLAKRRTKWLGEQSRPDPANPTKPPRSSEWEVSDGPAYVVIVDELPLLADEKELLDLYLEYLRIGRQAAVTSVWATQDLTGDTVGDTRLRKYVASMVMMACSREDVVIALGGKRIAEGWAPHRLIAATDEEVNDAGKAYVWAGNSKQPELWRFWRTSPAEVQRRAVERLAAGGWPTIDGGRGDVPLDAQVVPPELAVFVAAFEAARGSEWLPTEEILRHAAATGPAVDGAALAAMAAKHGFGTDPLRRRINGKGNPRHGYAAADVRAAVDRLPT